jgi:hypothetical protein
MCVWRLKSLGAYQGPNVTMHSCIGNNVSQSGLRTTGKRSLLLFLSVPFVREVSEEVGRGPGRPAVARRGRAYNYERTCAGAAAPTHREFASGTAVKRASAVRCRVPSKGLPETRDAEPADGGGYVALPAPVGCVVRESRRAA